MVLLVRADYTAATSEGRRHFESPIHFEAIAQYAHPGAVFDPNGGMVMPLVPVLLHVLVIMVLNTVYG